MTINAVGDVSPLLKNIETFPFLEDSPPLIVLLTPWGILEVVGYGIALSRSALIVYHLVTRKI